MIHGAIVITADTADAQVASNLSVVSSSATNARVGTGTGAPSNTWRSFVIPFSLATIPAGDVVTDATFTTNLETQNGTFTFNSDLYGLTASRGTATVLGTDHFHGTFGTDLTDAIGLQDNFSLPSSLAGSTSTSVAGSTALVTYLNSFSASFGTTNFVFLRLSPDETGTVTASLGTNFSSANHGTSANRPVLNVTTVPEPSTGVSVLAGLGMLAGLRRRRR
jgi:hypothetical protein